MNQRYNSESDGSIEVPVVVPRHGARPMPMWKKMLLVVSLVLMGVGLSLKAYTHVRKPATASAQVQPAPRAQTASSPRKSALPTAGQSVSGGAKSVGTYENSGWSVPGLPGTSEGVEAWSPAVFRLGFCFFVGFCIAHALRTFFRITAVVIGVMLLVLLGLQYGGIVQVDWAAMQREYDSISGWLSAQTAGFQRFVTGQLPSAASAAAGLLVGFKRH